MPDWLIYAGENEGLPLVVMLDKSWGEGFADRMYPWAVMVEVAAPRVDSNALPVADDWPVLEAIEAAFVRELATDEDDWRYVVRVYGEGVARFCFYARRSSAAAARVQRALGEFDGWEAKTSVQSDPKWSAYASFFPSAEGAAPKAGPTPVDERNPGVAPSFRDDPMTGPSPSFQARSGRPAREEQPWRGDMPQAHPED